MVTTSVTRKCFPPFRTIIWFMIFTCIWFYYMLRINMSIIILAMVEPARNEDNTTVIPECKRDTTNLTDNQQEHADVSYYGERYEWTPQTQGLILGAYFYGYVIGGVPGGYLSEKFGPKRCIIWSFVLSALLTLITPLIAGSVVLLVGTRVLTGIVGGSTYPSAHYLIAKYAPDDEKGKFVGALLGNNFGTVITWSMLGAIMESYDWSWAFYACGSIIVVWLVLFYFFVHDSVEDHPLMSTVEKDYIKENQAASPSLGVIKKAAPYGQIALSVPFWALVVLHFGNLWGLFFLLTAGPNFMSTVLGFSLGHTGILSSLPYLARFLFGLVFGQIGDLIFRRGWMGRNALVKTFVVFSHIVPGLLLLCQTFVGCDVTLSIVLLTTSLGMNGASSLTSLQNPHDLAPNFAPSIYAIINAIGSSTGFINPMIVGYVTAEKNGMAEWNVIFYIGSIVYIACGVIFWIFGSGNVQPWNESNNKNKPDVTK